MIEIKRADSLEDTYMAFTKGFSDYMIPMQLTYEEFVERIMRRDHNELEHSFLAYDGEEPVGIWLNGLKEIDGERVLRCGGLAVAPEYRKARIAQRLFDRQREHASKHGFDILFLEVIIGNDRALAFYEKNGYTIDREIRYYSRPRRTASSSLEEVSWLAYSSVEPAERPIWQRDAQAMRHIEPSFYRGSTGAAAVKNGQIIEVRAQEDDIMQLLDDVCALPFETFHFHATDPDLHRSLIQAGWTESNIKQYEMKRQV